MDLKSFVWKWDLTLGFHSKSHTHTHTLSCWTLLCRPSVVRLASLLGSWSWAVWSHLKRELERLRNCSSCCSQAWMAANLCEGQRKVDGGTWISTARLYSTNKVQRAFFFLFHSEPTFCDITTGTSSSLKVITTSSSPATIHQLKQVRSCCVLVTLQKS